MKASRSALFLAALALFSAQTADAVIVTVNLYELGEPGSYVDNRPQDSIGGLHFAGGAGTPMVLTDSPSPASSVYSRFEGQYAFAADLSAFPTDNFGIVLWARVSDSLQDAGLFASAKNNDGRLTFHLINGNWAASYKGLGWIGASSGAGQTVTADTWTQLAIIRENGIATFYINGVAQSGTSDQVPVFTNNAHFAVLSGGTPYLGDLDQLQFFTFDPLTDDPVAALAVIPEPANLATLTALLGIGFVVLRRRRS